MVSVNDAYAVVVSTGFPPKVSTMPPAELGAGRICQLRPHWNQLSIIQMIGRAVPNGTPPERLPEFCVGRTP